MATGKLLIFVVAYNAEKTIEHVLNRIPVEKLPAATEVLVIDDESADRTFQLAEAYVKAHPTMKLTVLRNPRNQGYGGNQKIGYEYAIENGFDAVALLHGDGQYAPEKLPDLVQPVLDGRADACFGTRMSAGNQAVRQGMPRYKYFGNRILSWFENSMIGLKLTEWHSGYRVYSVAALGAIPFRYNTNDFHFDTEIIIQLALAGRHVLEMPIPTFYGDEICHVNGLKYAWDIFRTVILCRLHRLGVFYQKSFDVETVSGAELKLGYASSHQWAVDSVKAGNRVLEVVCGPDELAPVLKGLGCAVTTVRCMPDGTLPDLSEPAVPYDVILVLDVVEHVAEPEVLLGRLRDCCFAGTTSVILSTANVGFLPVRMSLLAGRFQYSRRGILDLSHRRLFTVKSFRRLLEQEGYRIHRVRGIPGPYPKAFGSGAFSRFLLAMNRVLIFFSRGLFAYQVFAEATMTPPLHRMLRRTLDASGKASG